MVECVMKKENESELIIKSAKALESKGFKFEWISDMPFTRTHPSICDAFDPLKNDVDAFVLLSDLEIGVGLPFEGTRKACLSDIDCYHASEEKHGGTRGATRRAITLAAASMGRHT